MNEYKRTKIYIKQNLNKKKIINCINKTISNSSDQIQMWNNIKNQVLKSNRNVIFNNVEYKTNAEIANNFNEYFVNSIEEIRDKIEDVRYNTENYKWVYGNGYFPGKFEDVNDADNILMSLIYLIQKKTILDYHRVLC